ncbi:S1 RNA-binding domain-containing protein [Duganella hordei]|uniref:S1 RNA-binding domain-containing protein n=1 Tax=Duganella hordei TaxID=2865934 RepID=UPI0030E97050
MKLHQSSDPILQFLADYSNETLVRTFLDSFGDRRNAELRRLKVRMQGLETENQALRLGHLPMSPDATLETSVELVEGAILTGQVVGIDHLYSVIKLGDGAEHLIPLAEFIEDELLEIELGDYVNLVASVTPDGVALSHLNYKKMLRWVELVHAFDGNSSIKMLLQMPMKGGYSVSYRGIQGFIPHSQIDLSPGKHVDLLLDTLVEVKLLELDRSANRVIASRKQVMQEARDCFLANLRQGDMMDGVVKNIADFGAFVDVGGIVGLLHSSQMGPLAATIEVGAMIKVRVIKIDLEQKKISLSAKPVAPDAWEQVPARLAVGNKLDGKIKKLTQAGVLIEIMAGISGLVFQSDFKHAYPDDSAAPKVGDVVSVTIRDIDVERKRIGLRMRRLQGTKR